MHRSGNDATHRRNLALHIGSFRLDGERPNATPLLTTLSPTSCGIITPRRIVRTSNTSPAVTQLVRLDGVLHRPSSARTSVSFLSEDVVDDLASESVSATCEPGRVPPALAPDVFTQDGLSSSVQCATKKTTNPGVTHPTNGNSLYSMSSISPFSSRSSSSEEYTETFDLESVHSCSLTCVGDGKHGALSLSHHFSRESPGKDPESSFMHFMPSRRGSTVADAPPTRKIVNVRREERIGRGSYGDVFRAVDLDTGLPLAIKEILVTADISKNVEKQLRALEREIRVMRKLNHEHIISYYSARRDEECSALLIYMEYIGGGTIAQRLRTHGPFTEDETRNYTSQLLQGLEYLHQRRIVHRDLKGDNLFLTDSGVLKVGDFGTSKDLQTTLVTDSVAGTPNFMAPEVIACSGHSYMADIWSVGCCVLEMLTGHPPFWNLDNHMAVMFAIMKGGLEEQVPSHISDDAKDFIRQCVRSDPKERLTARQLQQHPWLSGLNKEEENGMLSCLSLFSPKYTDTSFSITQKENTSPKVTSLSLGEDFNNNKTNNNITAVVAIVPDLAKTGSTSLERVLHGAPKEKGLSLPSVAMTRTPATTKATTVHSSASVKTTPALATPFCNGRPNTNLGATARGPLASGRGNGRTTDGRGGSKHAHIAVREDITTRKRNNTNPPKSAGKRATQGAEATVCSMR